VALEWDERVEALLARRGVASTRDHQHSRLLMASPRIAQYSRRFLGEWGTGNGLETGAPL
jgi:hypothetical protein